MASLEIVMSLFKVRLIYLENTSKIILFIKIERINCFVYNISTSISKNNVGSRALNEISKQN